MLALFLRLRLALWVSIGIPISFMGALALFPAFGVSIDVISLFAFILVLGIVVDDAIVVGENVHRHQEQGEPPLAAAIKGTQEVAMATQRKVRVRRGEQPDPSPELIRRMSAAIRAGWSERERAKRAGRRDTPWTPPSVHQEDFRVSEHEAGNHE